MSTEANKAVLQRFVEEVMNRKNLAVIDELYAADAVEHVPGGPPLDREGVKQFLGMLLTAFPDLHETIEDTIAEGDRVVTRSTYHGKHTGDFLGIPPTGKQVTITGIHLTRVANGKMVEDWADFDQLGMLQQIGVIPSMG
ncbi:MAG: ester cyclase [Ktedonobacteraceae bacterium]